MNWCHEVGAGGCAWHRATAFTALTDDIMHDGNSLEFLHTLMATAAKIGQWSSCGQLILSGTRWLPFVAAELQRFPEPLRNRAEVVLIPVTQPSAEQRAPRTYTKLSECRAQRFQLFMLEPDVLQDGGRVKEGVCLQQQRDRVSVWLMSVAATLLSFYSPLTLETFHWPRYWQWKTAYKPGGESANLIAVMAASGQTPLGIPPGPETQIPQRLVYSVRNYPHPKVS